MDEEGSLRHIRWYVNQATNQLDATVFTSSSSLALSATGSLTWVSPLAAEGHKEYWNSAFLQRLGAEHSLAEFQEFWPFSGAGTPHWDALATVPLTSGRGAVMVEAKAHKAEFANPSDAAGATGAALEKIRSSLEKAREFYGADSSATPWESSHYQLCNRLALLFWMNVVAQVPTWLVWAFVCDDPVWSDGLSAPRWATEFERALQDVGLAGSFPLRDRISVAYLAAAPPVGG